MSEIDYFKTYVYPDLSESEIQAKIDACRKAEEEREKFLKTIIFRKSKK